MTSTRLHRSSRGPGRHDKGAAWISYSDMMASLILMFVLVLSYSIYQYFVMLQTKTAELDDKVALLSSQQITLDEQTTQLLLQQQTLDQQKDALATAQTSLSNQQLTLEEQQRLLNAANAALATREEELAAAQLKLGDQQNKLDAATVLLNSQRDALEAQQVKIDDLIGVRTKIIQDLSATLTSANLKSTVDRNTGDIVLDSAVFFDTGQSTIKDSGKALLNQFIPLYLSVLLRPEYEDYLGEIVIEGHTDTQGSEKKEGYLMNLELSQQRALAVAKYCLQMDGLTDEQREYLRKILTAKGKSYSDPIYNANGSVNMDQSRRVEFQFRLRDAEMINEMNRILSGQ